MDKKVDKVGRIVIPIHLREKYGLKTGTKIEFLDFGDIVAVRASEPCCKICHAKIEDNKSLPLCETCIEKAVNGYEKSKERDLYR